MNTGKALFVLSILMIAAILHSGVGFSAPPAAGTPATKPAGHAASMPASTRATYPLWDGKESVADYAKRAGIKVALITLALDGNVTMKLTLIPAGKFLMGSPAGEKDRYTNEGPQHEVTISNPFYMGVYTVTQEQYQQVMGKNPSEFKGAQNPVETVPLDDSVEFCKKISQKTARLVRLPTEAQWEHACRAGSKTRFSYGDDNDCRELGDYAWHEKNNDGKMHPVGQKKPNDWGLYDMHGNVSQWCADWYTDTYDNAGKIDPTGPASGVVRVVRGGGWPGIPHICRSAHRIFDYPDTSLMFRTGFRVVVEMK